MSKSETMALLEIMEILALPGELYSDGLVLDEIISIIIEMGLPFAEEQARMGKVYKQNQDLNWNKMTLQETISKLQESE